MTDLDKPCLHENTEAQVVINRIIKSEEDHTPIAFMADIRAWCTDCQEDFRWSGVPAGLNYGRPTCSVDEKELHAPMRPASSDPDFGMGLPGFSINYRA